MMVIYISGPISGKRDNNRTAFEEAHLKILAAAAGANIEDFKIINPLDLATEVNAVFDELNKHRFHKIKPAWCDYMKKDIAALCTATYVLFIDGWQESKGAMLERQIADAIGISCVESVEDLMKLAKESGA
jgi:hypothetical protein